MKAKQKQNSAPLVKVKNTSWSTKALVFCSLMAALCVVMLYMGSLSVLDLTAVAICALVTMLIVVELGNKYAWIVVCVVGILALILLPSKLLALTYILIGGIYPILKGHFELFRSSLAWLFKMSAMGTMLLILSVLARLVFTTEETYFAIKIPVILMGLLFLAIYDLALTGCITFYIVKLRNRLGLKKLF